MSQSALPPGSQSSLREANRVRVLDSLKRHGGLTQVEIASATGLSPATVSAIVKELELGELVATTPVIRSGRRAQQVRLARQLGLVGGVDFSDRALRVALADLSGQILATRHMPIPADHRADTGLDRAALLLSDLLDGLSAEPGELRAIGLGVPARVDPNSGTVATTGLLRGWEEVSIASALGARTGVAVHVDNSVNLAAAAEFHSGAGQGVDVGAYIHVGHHVDAGLFFRGELFSGHAGGAGAIAHIRVQEAGLVCRCGNRGCLDTLVSASALTEALRPTHGVLSLADIVDNALAGDAPSVRLLAEAGHLVGLALAATCNVVSPRTVVVGGELARSGDLLLEPMRATAVRAILPNRFAPLTLLPGVFGAEAAMRGATRLALTTLTIPRIQEAHDDDRAAV